VAVASAGPYPSLHLAPDKITTPCSQFSLTTIRPGVLAYYFYSGCQFLPPNQQCRSTEGKAIGNMHQKFGEDRTCSSEDMIADRQTHRHTQTHTHTYRHPHHNAPLHNRGRSRPNNCEKVSQIITHINCSCAVKNTCLSENWRERERQTEEDDRHAYSCGISSRAII